ncbi:MAG: uracil-DNA glycosylase [Ancylobacter novellus]|uniref:Uracil-DNA glycosylase n=1 Tax=Ancylobacter novellus TaxID=921 RepID=A0A2W5M368_ANCNO|nr:MAG: uracil-DNA glycosylase [Ancylobacter novellus]
MGDEPRNAFRREASSFVADLASMESAHAFNPYSGHCAVHDCPDADLIRLDNLTRLLEAALANGVDAIWVARDLGYLGGRRTGLALTDEAHLADLAGMFGLPCLRRATVGPAVSERTATYIYRTLLRISAPTFLWNVFPLHPHEPGKPFSNRGHTAAERRSGQAFLQRLIDILRPRRVVAIGGDAARALEGIGVAHAKVRHPSYGGHIEFAAQVAALYELPPVPETGLLAQNSLF